MGPKIVLFCTIVAIANGGVIENVKRKEVAQTDPNSALETASPSRCEAGEAPTLDSVLHESVDVTGKIGTTNYFGNAAGFPSPPAFRSSIVEKLSNPSRVVRAAGRKDVDGQETEAGREGRLNDGASILPGETHEDRKGLERIEKLSNPSRAVRQAGYYKIRFPIISPPENIPSACCPTTTPTPCTTSTCPPVCPATRPVTCATTPCPSNTTPPPCCSLPATGDAAQTFYDIGTSDPRVSYSSYLGAQGQRNGIMIDPRSNTFRTPSNNADTLNSRASVTAFRDPTESYSSFSAYPTRRNNINADSRSKTLRTVANNPRGNSVTADPRTHNQPQQTSRVTVPRRGPFNFPVTSAAPSNTRGTAGIMKNSGNGVGGNNVRSSINVLSGSSCTDPCSNQNACMISDSGNGRGGNKVTSCINYVTGGNMLCNSGQGEGGNDIQSLYNIVGGNGASLVDGSNGAVLQSLYNMVIGQNCSLFGFNYNCDDDDSSEEDDPCPCQPTTPCPCSDDPCQPSTPNNYPPCIILPGSSIMYPNKKK